MIGTRQCSKHYNVQTLQCSNTAMLNKASDVFSSINPILEDVINDCVEKVSVVSDSPTSQYRNKNMFWLMENFVKEHNIALHWIYLESNKGQGIPDGIGAQCKRVYSK